MRRLILTLTTILIICANIFAATTINDELAKSVGLQGGYKAVTEFYITPIVVQSEGYMIGMPFNIEGSDVQYKPIASATAAVNEPTVFQGGSGRVIADWNMLFNVPVDVTITAEPMTPDVKTDSDGNPTYPTDDAAALTFTVAFSYKLSYMTSSGISYADGYIIYDGGAGGKCYIYDISKHQTYPLTLDAATATAPFASYLEDVLGIKSNSLVGESDGKVLFGFSQAATNSIAENEWPDGEYSATVKLVFTAKESS